MLSKLSVITIFIIKCGKKTSPKLSGHIRKNISESMTNIKCVKNFKITITQYNKNLFQSVTGIRKRDKKLLRSVTGIT